jgi:hypothetical protein
MSSTVEEVVRNESRYHGKLWTRQGPWDIYFVDALRIAGCWVIECVAVGPRVHTATVRCDDRGAAETARRVTAVLRDWLASGDLRDEVFLEAPREVAVTNRRRGSLARSVA